MCPLTTTAVEAPLARLPPEPAETNGLGEHSSLMVERVTTMPRENARAQRGRLTDEDMLRLSRAIIVFLNLASRGLSSTTP